MNELERKKIKLGLITIYLDYIDDVLKHEKYPDTLKFRALNTSMQYRGILKQLNQIEKKIEIAETSKNKLLDLAFGNQSYENLDEYKEQIISTNFEMMKGKFFLKDE